MFVEAPNGTRSWRAENTRAIADAVPQFATTNITPTTDAPVLLAGYSGGAEFLGGHVLREEGTDWLPAGSGAVMIGGGTYGKRIDGATAAPEDTDLTWVVSNRDGAYAIDAESRSAQSAAAQSVSAYQRAGYDEAQLITTAGVRTDYDIPGIIADRLARLDD